jgi:predicted enzyme related to lactoylglutathione lyase
MLRMLTRLALTCACALSLLTVTHGQTTAPATASALPAGPPPTGIVVGSGNFYSPIVADLERAVAFYRDGFGLDAPAAPATGDTNAPIRHMFGVPDARLRWTVARPPGLRGGVEIVEITNITRTPRVRRPSDPGAVTLVAFVRDLDAVSTRLLGRGGTVVTRGGTPITLPIAAGKARVVTIADPDGHFVELVQPDPLPPTQVPATAVLYDVRLRLTVDDAATALRLYADGLGLKAVPVNAFQKDRAVLDMLGVEKGEFRFASAHVPTTGLVLEFIEYKGLDRTTVRGDIQDPGSTRVQLQVRDVDEAIRAVTARGGQVVSTGGVPVELPGRAAPTKAAVVRDPNNLFLVLIQAPRPAN